MEHVNLWIVRSVKLRNDNLSSASSLRNDFLADRVTGPHFMQKIVSIEIEV
jgi:hypothetical protein